MPLWQRQKVQEMLHAITGMARFLNSEGNRGNGVFDSLLQIEINHILLESAGAPAGPDLMVMLENIIMEGYES